MKYGNKDRGSALLAILILTTLAGIILASTLGMASTHLLSTKAQKDRMTSYLEAEESLHKTINWLRDNSKEFVSFAAMDSVYSEFDFND
ncbi:MAG: hypothetical protein KDD62_09020, partial [Bdellovibrionales bacterium]|nr:hypothetical protein [Bdellovibrionales bacterium]